MSWEHYNDPLRSVDEFLRREEKEPDLLAGPEQMPAPSPVNVDLIGSLMICVFLIVSMFAFFGNVPSCIHNHDAKAICYPQAYITYFHNSSGKLTAVCGSPEGKDKYEIRAVEYDVKRRKQSKEMILTRDLP
jgi:hypothetical protein